MDIRINYAGLDNSDALSNHINDRIAHALRHHGERFTRVEVHLHDDNGSGKGGPSDKRCVVEARPKGFDPVLVEHATDDMYKTVTETAAKLERVVQSFVERHASH